MASDQNGSCGVSSHGSENSELYVTARISFLQLIQDFPGLIAQLFRSLLVNPCPVPVGGAGAVDRYEQDHPFLGCNTESVLWYRNGIAVLIYEHGRSRIESVYCIALLSGHS